MVGNKVELTTDLAVWSRGSYGQLSVNGMLGLNCKVRMDEVKRLKKEGRREAPSNFEATELFHTMGAFPEPV